MKPNTLPAPGSTPEAFHLRRLVEKIISRLEISSRNRVGNLHPDAVKLQAFLDAASAHIDPMTTVGVD